MTESGSISNSTKANSISSSPTANPVVFVVHGRDIATKDALFQFLRALGLKPLEWSHAVALTQQGSPYVGEVLDAAFHHAQAVVVLLTPDDEVRLNSRFHSPNEPPFERELTGQARPNVLFEAGMAMGRKPDRTVIVEVGTTRPFSDIVGRHVVRLSNEAETKIALCQRLATAGCPCDTSGTDWIRIGDFGQKRNEAANVQNANSMEGVIAKPKLVHVFSQRCTYYGTGSYLAVDPEKRLGKGRVDVSRSGILIERFNVEGSYHVDILSFTVNGQSTPYLKTTVPAYGDHVFRIAFTARLDAGTCQIKIASCDYSTKTVVDYRFAAVTSAKRARIDCLVIAPVSAQCYFQIHQFDLTEPTKLEIANLRITAVGGPLAVEPPSR